VPDDTTSLVESGPLPSSAGTAASILPFPALSTFPGEDAESAEKTDLGVVCLSSLASSSFLLLESDITDGKPEIEVIAFGVVFSGRSLEDGVEKARGVEGLTGSASPVFNNSENDFFCPANAPNPPVEPLKAPNPSDVVGFSTVGVGGDTGGKIDFGPPRAEGEPNVGVLTGVVEDFAWGRRLLKAETGGLSSGFLKKGEVGGVTALPKAPKPAAGLNADGVI